jgi:H/ACA ribonucleoprotein complex subunit 3
MKTLIKKCASCGIYTMKGFCPKCNSKTLVSDPPKFSPEDKYGEIRRKLITEDAPALDTPE